MLDVEFFKQNGYLHSGISLPPEQLSRFRAIADEIEAKALEAHKRDEQLPSICVIKDPVGPRTLRCDELQVHYPEDVNRLLALPELLGMIKTLCGPKAIILQVDLLYKHQHPHPVIRWHQGAPSEHDSHYLNIGIYLDNADLDDGCLRYVPGTQHELQDIDAVERQYGWNPPGVVQLPAKAGEILVQEMMVLHSSEPKRTPGPRRTIYVEARLYDAIKSDGKQDLQWLELRRFWMAEILKHDEAGIFTEEEKAFFQEGKELELDALMTEMLAHRNPPVPAVYNWQPATGPGYPIPDDLKEASKPLAV